MFSASEDSISLADAGESAFAPPMRAVEVFMRFEIAAGPQHSRRDENEPMTSPRRKSGLLAALNPDRSSNLRWRLWDLTRASWTRMHTLLDERKHLRRQFVVFPWLVIDLAWGVIGLAF